eukprot:11228331-Lingulodinium_polyedra.AAC.3
MPHLVVPLRSLDPREPPPKGCVGALHQETLSVGQLEEHGQLVGGVTRGIVPTVLAEEFVEGREESVRCGGVGNKICCGLLHLLKPSRPLPRPEGQIERDRGGHHNPPQVCVLERQLDVVPLAVEHVAHADRSQALGVEEVAHHGDVGARLIVVCYQEGPVCQWVLRSRRILAESHQPSTPALLEGPVKAPETGEGRGPLGHHARGTTPCLPQGPCLPLPSCLWLWLGGCEESCLPVPPPSLLLC